MLWAFLISFIYFHCLLWYVISQQKGDKLLFCSDSPLFVPKSLRFPSSGKGQKGNQPFIVTPLGKQIIFYSNQGNLFSFLLFCDQGTRSAKNASGASGAWWSFWKNSLIHYKWEGSFFLLVFLLSPDIGFLPFAGVILQGTFCIHPQKPKP